MTKSKDEKKSVSIELMSQERVKDLKPYKFNEELFDLLKRLSGLNITSKEDVWSLGSNSMQIWKTSITPQRKFHPSPQVSTQGKHI